jgi:DnaK suppressor protein
VPKTKQSEKSAAAENGWKEFREVLTVQRKEIMDLYEHDLKEGQRAVDEGSEDVVDRANRAYNSEMMLALSGAERETLFQIEEAIGRLDKGGFGACTNCESEIPEARLKAVPWARYCIDCQELEEKGLLQET